MNKHIVQPGECLATIAKQYGFKLWTTIYEAPENAEFRQRRPNPNVIYGGDEIFIPEKKVRMEEKPTEQKHKFKLKAKTWVFRMEMRDENLDPIEDEPYVLEIEGGAPVKGKTAASGVIEVPVPQEARHGILKFMGEELNLQFGKLDPVSRITGVQQRLNNLGFMAGAVDGIVGPITRRAVYEFQMSQEKNGLELTGTIDEATRRCLLELHDNDHRCVAAEENMSSVGSLLPDPESQPEAGDASEEPLGDQTDQPKTEEWNDEPFAYKDF